VSAADTVVARLRAAGCVFAEDEARLIREAAATLEAVDAMVERRVAGLPLEQLVGWAEFCGLRITLEPGVFVPRQRTGFLVSTAIGLAVRSAADPVAGGEPARAPIVVVDLCCGSGAIGAALAERLGQDRTGQRSRRVELHATDIDPAAVRCARRNVVAPHRVYQGDLFEPLPSGLHGRVDLLVANTPYVPTGAVELLPREARLHEPRVALDGGPDGLALLRRIAAAAPQWLAPGGHLLIETSEDQEIAAQAAFTDNGLQAQVTRSAEQYATVVVGTRLSVHEPA